MLWSVMRGTFIVLEGPDGSGTTTHAALLAKNLQAKGEKVLLTQEPTTGAIGSFIRQQLSKGVIPPAALQLLFTADRAWHVSDIILPALEDGQTVISDRYSLSTMIYGATLGLSKDWLETMNKYFIQPDVQIIALPSFDTCFRRVNGRATKDMLETDSLQRAVYDGYASYAVTSHIPTLDTSGSTEGASQQLLELVTATR